MSESITTAHPQYLRKDINGDSVLATFEGFLNQLQAKGQSGKILQIISNPAEQGLGGLGKTFEIWNLLTWFRDKNHLSDVLEVIDFSEDSDRFGILNQVVTNLEAQTSKAAFTTFNDFRDSIKKQESILQNSISKTAEETFYMDLAKNKKWKIKNNNPPILFFDSTDWIIDEEILKLRKTQTIVDNWESRLRESEIKQGSFFNWLIGEEGLFKRLVNSGIFIVLSGRYDLSIISSYKANNVIGEFISKTILLGGFNLDDLKSYIKNALHINEIPADILNDTRLQSILDISKNKPVMAVAIADFIANQYRKGRPETLNQKLWIRLDSVKPSQSYWELLEFFIDNLYDLTGSLESAEAVKLMNLVFYGLEPDKFAELMMPKGSEFWKAIEGLSLVKRYPNARTGRPLKYLRPHDDILVEFHKYWKEKNDPFKDFWYPRCLEEFGRSSVWKKLESEDTLLKNQELYYLTYLFEAATSDEDWEKATRYAQYVFSEHIDQNPDHAERILSRSEIYLPFIKEKFKDFSNAQLDYCFWISFRRVEYWLTERSTESEVKAKERLELMLDRLKGKNKNNQISVVYGYLGEYYIWNNLFEKAEDYLNLAISEAIHSGDETQLIPWLLHLKGFRYNRNADFEKALLFNL